MYLPNPMYTNRTNRGRHYQPALSVDGHATCLLKSCAFTDWSAEVKHTGSSCTHKELYRRRRSTQSYKIPLLQTTKSSEKGKTNCELLRKRRRCSKTLNQWQTVILPPGLVSLVSGERWTCGEVGGDLWGKYWHGLCIFLTTIPCVCLVAVLQRPSTCAPVYSQHLSLLWSVHIVSQLPVRHYSCFSETIWIWLLPHYQTQTDKSAEGLWVKPEELSRSKVDCLSVAEMESISPSI